MRLDLVHFLIVNTQHKVYHLNHFQVRCSVALRALALLYNHRHPSPGLSSSPQTHPLFLGFLLSYWEATACQAVPQALGLGVEGCISV